MAGLPNSARQPAGRFRRRARAILVAATTGAMVWASVAVVPAAHAGSAAVLRQFGIPGPAGLPADGYVLAAGRDHGRPAVVLSGAGATGTFYAVQTFRQLLTRRGHVTFVAGVQVRDWPSFAIRGGMESFYGNPWPQADALHQIAFLGEHKMNAFLYTAAGDPRTAGSLWRSPYPPAQLARFAALVRAADASHVDFMYRIDPEAQLDPQIQAQYLAGAVGSSQS